MNSDLQQHGKDMKTIKKKNKKKQSQMKDTLTEMTTTLQGIKSRVGKAKNQISNLDYKETKNNSNRNKESRMTRLV